MLLPLFSLPNFPDPPPIFFSFFHPQVGSAVGSELVLPALRSVGSFYVDQNKYSMISLPTLTEMTSGGITLWNTVQLRHFDMVSLEDMEGDFRINNVPALSSLCHFNLPASGRGGSRFQIVNAVHLSQVP